MRHQITLSENDYITYYLYEASTNPIKRKNRLKSYLFLNLFAMLIVVFSYTNNNHFLMYYGVLCVGLAMALGQPYIKWRHKKHYTKHTKELLKNRFEEKVEIEILDEIIATADKTGSSNIIISEIDVVKEIADHYFIKLTTSHTLIVPKTNLALNGEVLAMVKKHNITFVEHLHWKW